MHDNPDPSLGTPLTYRRTMGILLRFKGLYIHTVVPPTRGPWNIPCWFHATVWRKRNNPEENQYPEIHGPARPRLNGNDSHSQPAQVLGCFTQLEHPNSQPEKEIRHLTPARAPLPPGERRGRGGGMEHTTSKFSRQNRRFEVKFPSSRRLGIDLRVRLVI